MKHYPSIDNSFKAPNKPCHVFIKYDGSNIRAQYSKKRGWYKFGTRNHLLDETDQIYGKAIPIFNNKYADDLELIFNSNKLFKGIKDFVVFFEFFGSKTFGGMHYPDDLFDVVLFDVNPLNKGMLNPEQFLDCFGHLKVAELLCKTDLDEDFIYSVREEKIPIDSKYQIRAEVPEGVICKGSNCSTHEQWSCKIKTNRYKEELKKRYSNDWSKFWE